MALYRSVRPCMLLVVVLVLAMATAPARAQQPTVYYVTPGGGLVAAPQQPMAAGGLPASNAVVNSPVTVDNNVRQTNVQYSGGGGFFGRLLPLGR